jgi:Xaa-Pro dipeptidase
MYAHRIDALKRLQQQNNVYCVALMPGANLRYFFGLAGHLSERPTVGLIPADGPAAAVLPVLEAQGVQDLLPPDVRLYAYRDEDGHEGAFRQAADELGLAGRTIGVEYLAMRLLEARRLEQAAPGCRLVATEPWLPPLRMAKDETEIAAMRRAIDIAQRALERLLAEGSVRPGRTELEVAADLQVALLCEGGQGEAFPPIVVAGPNSAFPHAGPSDRPMAEGDLVTLDWGTVYDGYRSDLTRTFYLGPSPSTEVRRIYDAVLAANEAGRLAGRPGLPAEEVDRAARRVIDAQGYGQYFIHRTGHGLGLETHEPPYMVEGNSEPLRAGVTYTVEPGIYVPGLGGVRIEDDVHVTAAGSETLSTLPRELKLLG